MRSILFEDCTEVKTAQALGSDAILDLGFGCTRSRPGACTEGWFVGDSTVILGAGLESSETIARWSLTVDPAIVERCNSGYLVICCERTHGGLHTAREGAQARVSINGVNRDLIGLRAVPPGHTDYFHRPVNSQKLPDVWPVSGCATVYVWPVDKRHLGSRERHEVVVDLEPDVRWDVDYVCLVLSHEFKELRDSCKQVFYVLLGVGLGALATILVGQ
jgi:hypothetical protein